MIYDDMNEAISRAEELILTKGRTMLSAEQRALLELAQVLRAVIQKLECL